MVLTPKKSRTVKCENRSKKVFCVTKGARGRIEGDTDRRLVSEEFAEAFEKLRRGFANDNTEDVNRRLIPEEVADAREGLRRGFVNDNTEDANRRLTPEEIADAREKIRKRFEKLARRYGFVME